MQKNTYEQGIGLIAVLIIAAVVAVGGYATVKVVQDSRATVDTEEQEDQKQEVDEKLAEVRADVVATFNQVQANVVLSAQASVDAAVQSLNELSTRVDQAMVEAQGEARAEIVALKSEIDRLKVKLQAKSQDAVVDIQTFVDDIQADIDASAEVNGDSSLEDDDSSMSESEDDGVMINIDSETEVDGSMSEGDVETSANSTTTTEASY